MKLSSLITCTLLCIHALVSTASADLLSASTEFLDSLSEEQMERVVLPFDSEERLNWHFVTKDRIGINFSDLGHTQDQLMRNIVRAGLSEEGYSKAEGIRSLEAILFKMEGSSKRDTNLYHILFFGMPSANGDWTVRYEGHNLSLHWTFVN